jgi:uridylate kinase
LSFGSDAYNQVISDPDMVKGVNESIIIGSGWKPGCSTDTDAVLVAKDLGAKKIINLSNIDYVYDCDPRTNNNAKKFENLDWQTYRTFISSVWKPGSNTPFDPIASEMAEKEGMEVAFISGQNLESLEKYLNDEPFTGTTIK